MRSARGAVAAMVALLLALPVPSQVDPRSDGTRKMAERLRKIFAEQDWKSDPNKQDDRAAYYKAVLAKNPDIRTALKARLYLAQMLLQSGHSADAVEELVSLRKYAASSGVTLAPAFDRDLRQTLAMAYLRQGEQQNCQTNHNADSCIYPLRAGGIHKDTGGALGAVREWSALLGQEPDNLSFRWLLNIAYMAAGQVAPERWRVSNSFLESDYDIGRFTDVAGAAGAGLTGHAGGVIADDLDGDGYFDLIVSSSGPLDQLRYLHNNGDGTFTDQTIAAGLEGEVGGLNIVHADYNNDGRPDIVVLRGGWLGENGKYPFSLLRNNGANAQGQVTFSDVTEEAGLLSYGPTQTAGWADFDNDGWLDLFVGHESEKGSIHASELWHNNHDGTFTNVAAQVGLADVGFVKGAAWGDFNNDGRQDLLLTRHGEGNRLFRNDGPDRDHFWKFTDVTQQAGVSGPVASFSTWFFDYDNDGWPDIMVAGYAPEQLKDLAAFHMGLPNLQETPHLFHNNGDGTFRDVSKEMHLDRAILSMGAGFGDLDNDGWLDCYFGTGAPEYEALLPNRMFRNDRGKSFQDVTQSGGFGQLQKGHAIAFADLNRDGQQDVFEVLGGAYPGDTYLSALLGNPGHDNHWLGLKLEGVQSNRGAIGARVRVDVTGVDGKQTFYRTVQSGTSFGDAPLELHVGVGQAFVSRVDVTWPSGVKQTFRGLGRDGIYGIREGDAAAVRREVKAFRFGPGGMRDMHHR